MYMIFCENVTFKILFHYFLTKVYDRFKLKICGLQDQCLRPLSHDDKQFTRLIETIFTKDSNRHIVT